MEAEGLRYELLGGQHLPLRRHFRCGKEPLDVYLRSKRAWQEQEKYLAVVRILYDAERNRIAGYYTLSAFYIEPTLLPEEFRGRAGYDIYPATLIGRLARDRDYAARKVGGRLLLDALKRALDASSTVASCAVVVDALDVEAEHFYQHYGFEILETEQHDRRLYLPMETISDLFASTPGIQ
jgi:predicted GNAT family N-acyltransferase